MSANRNKASPAIEKPLTPRQQAFVSEYLVDLNSTQAAIRAGYAPRSASVTACRPMAKADVPKP